MKVATGPSTPDITLDQLTYRDMGYAGIAGNPKVSMAIDLTTAEFIEAVKPIYDVWRAEQREQDQRETADLIYLKSMGYPEFESFMLDAGKLNDFICNYVPEEVLQSVVHLDRKAVSWCINELFSVETTKESVALNVLAYKLAALTRTEAHPTILFNNELTPGHKVLAALHASMAWHLARVGQSSQFNDVPFSDADFRGIPPASLQATTDQVAIRLTESRLGGQETAVVQLPRNDPSIAAQHLARLASTSAVGVTRPDLKMYVLVDQALPPSAMMSAGATAIVSCYNNFHATPEMSAWAAGIFNKVVCQVSQKEIRQAQNAMQFSAVDHPQHGTNVALAFSPRSEWPTCFKYFRKV
jgi:hypothetical protein